MNTCGLFAQYGAIHNQHFGSCTGYHWCSILHTFVLSGGDWQETNIYTGVFTGIFINTADNRTLLGFGSQDDS